jgi:hypothetical protein
MFNYNITATATATVSDAATTGTDNQQSNLCDARWTNPVGCSCARKQFYDRRLNPSYTIIDF